ncbi:MAG: pyridoxal-phosphate dependent enzyme, partial [Pseudomonadota bacterium]
MNIDMIRAAATRLEGHARVTPMLNSPFIDEIAGRRVWIKPECLQRTGSFKFRGGWSALSALDPETRARGVIAFSSGNHAQGVAHAATLHGVPSVIVMPSDAPALPPTDFVETLLRDGSAVMNSIDFGVGTTTLTEAISPE